MPLRLSRLQSRRLAVMIGGARMGLGAAALVFPQVLLRPWVGDRSDDSGALLLARALGARDMALGSGAVLGFLQDAPMRWWVSAGGLADAADAAATLLSLRRLPAVGRWLVTVAATGGAVAAVLASGGVDAA